MSETQRYEFNHQELVTSILKHKKIYEGIWCLEVRFNWAAANIQMNNTGVLPTAFCAVESFAITRVAMVDALSVDASVVNPRHLILTPFEGT